MNKSKKPGDDIPRIIICIFFCRARAIANQFHEDRGGPSFTQERLRLSDKFIAILCISTARKKFSASSLVTGKSRSSTTLAGTLKYPLLTDDKPMLLTSTACDHVQGTPFVKSHSPAFSPDTSRKSCTTMEFLVPMGPIMMVILLGVGLRVHIEGAGGASQH